MRGEGPDPGALSEILTALVRDERALSACTRVITAALLICSEQAQKEPTFWRVVESALGSDSGLVLLPGIALTVMAGQPGCTQMLERWQNYQQDFISLAPEQQEDLLRLARELGKQMRVDAATKE